MVYKGRKETLGVGSFSAEVRRASRLLEGGGGPVVWWKCCGRRGGSGSNCLAGVEKGPFSVSY